MKRNRFLLIGFLLIVFALASLAPVAAQGETLLIWADNERATVLQELGEQFAEEFGVTVEVQIMGLGDARDQLLVAGPVGEGPDILVIAHDTIGQLVTNGALLPVELGDLASDFSERSLDLFTYEDGNLYAVPYAIENVALFRNDELVPDLPESWDDVRAISEELQSSGDADYGLVMQTGNTYHNFPILSGFGGYIFGYNDDGTYNVGDIGLASDGGFAAGEWLSGMYVDGLMPPDVNDDVAIDLFASGDAAMIVTGPWFAQRVADAVDDGAGFDWSIDPLPGAPFLGGQGFAISAFTENELLAETFLFDFVATEDAMTAIFEGGGREPAFLAVDTSDNPYIEFFAAAGENAIPMPTVPAMSSVWAASDAALTLISQGGDPVEAYTTAANQIAENIVAAETGAVNSVTIAGDFQEELGCPGDWQPDCEATMLEDQGDGIWTATWTIPAGEWQFKAALNADWAEAYPADNAMLSLEAETEVTFTFNNNEKTIETSVGE
jgi:maltose-binding protein MalE